MYIPDELKKVNKFVDVAIPSNKAYFSRLGEVSPVSTLYTGDQVAPMNQDKISQIEDYVNYAKSLESENYNKDESD